MHSVLLLLLQAVFGKGAGKAAECCVSARTQKTQKVICQRPADTYEDLSSLRKVYAITTGLSLNVYYVPQVVEYQILVISSKNQLISAPL